MSKVSALTGGGVSASMVSRGRGISCRRYKFRDSVRFRALQFWIHPDKMVGEDREMYEDMVDGYRKQHSHVAGMGSDGEFLIKVAEDNGKDWCYVEFQGGLLEGRRIGYNDWLLEFDDGGWMVLGDREFSRWVVEEG